MTKKLLPTLIGTVLVGGMAAAQADVTVFGHIDTSINSRDTDAGFINTGTMPGNWIDFGGSNINLRDNDDINLKSNTSSIGFKGSEDLGNGLKAVFKIDFQYDIANARSSGISDRDQWLGLAGNFGSVKFGTISTSYKSHGAMIDPLYRTAAQNRSNGLQSFLHSGAGEEGEGRADNTIRYDSPNWNGLKVTAHYTLDSDETSDCFPSHLPGSSCEDDDAYGVGVQYTNGGILVFADYVTNNSDSNIVGVGAIPGVVGTGNSHGDLSAYKVGGKYTMNNFTVYGQYEHIEDDFGGGGLGVDIETDFIMVAGSYTMGNNMLYAGYGNADTDDIFGGPVSTGQDQTAFTLAGVHSLSKRTSVYLAYTMVEQDNDTALDAALTGLVLGSGGFDTVKDPEQSIVALGMKHKF